MSWTTQKALTPAVVAILMLAGCLSARDDAPAPASTPDAPVPEFEVGPPVLVGPGGDAEVSLFVADDGETILACSHGGFRIPSPFWASTDGGLSFQRHEPGPNPVPSGDCDVAVLEDGSWVMIYDTIASTTVAVTSDEGATWNINPVAAAPIGGVDRPWVHPAGNDILLTYANVMVAEPAIQVFARSTDHGRTFPEHTLINLADPPQRTNSIIGHLISYDDHQTLQVPIARVDYQGGGPYWFSLATSHDAGATWTVSDAAGPIETSTALPSMTRTPDGRLHYVITGDGQEGADVELISSDDDGATWSDPVTVATGVRFPGVRGPWVDARSDGLLTLAWMHHDDGEEPGWETWAARVDPANATEPVRFLGPVSEPVDESNIFEFIMVRHGPDDRAHILYLVTGPDCKDPDPTSSRSAQCVWLVSETA